MAFNFLSLIQGNKEKIVSGFIGGLIRIKCPVSLSRGDELQWKDNVYNIDRVPILIYSSKTGVNRRHPNQQQISVENHVLIIHGLRDFDAGDYYCIVKRKNRSEERYHYVMDLYTKPECRGRAQVVEGGKVTLRCRTDVSMGGTPNMEWKKNDRNITSKDKSDIYQAQKEISFKASMMDDGENYTCVVSAKTVGGIASESCSVTIRILFAAKDAKVIPDKDVYNIGDVISFSVQGNPMPELHLTPSGTLAKDGTVKVKVTKDMADKNFTYVLNAKNKLSTSPVVLRKYFFVQGLTTTEKTTLLPKVKQITVKSHAQGANIVDFDRSASVKHKLKNSVSLTAIVAVILRYL